MIHKEVLCLNEQTFPQPMTPCLHLLKMRTTANCFLAVLFDRTIVSHAAPIQSLMSKRSTYSNRPASAPRIVGIVLGALSICALFGILLFLYFRKHSFRHAESSPKPIHGEQRAMEQNALAAYAAAEDSRERWEKNTNAMPPTQKALGKDSSCVAEMGGYQKSAELHGVGRVELQSQSQLVELPSHPRPVELPARSTAERF